MNNLIRIYREELGKLQGLERKEWLINLYELPNFLNKFNLRYDQIELEQIDEEIIRVIFYI